jgi:hypothetical protein
MRFLVIFLIAAVAAMLAVPTEGRSFMLGGDKCVCKPCKLLPKLILLKKKLNLKKKMMAKTIKVESQTCAPGTVPVDCMCASGYTIFTVAHEEKDHEKCTCTFEHNTPLTGEHVDNWLTATVMCGEGNVESGPEVVEEVGSQL